MTVWFTSDTHYFHKNIIKYSQRHFKDIEEMNEVLINNHNKVVKGGDTVFHLGDFCFKDNQYKALLKCINGNIIHIKGNHDSSKQTRIKDLTLSVNNKLWQLVHRPIDGSNNIILCGHVHNTFHTYKDDEGKLFINVGVDVNNYRPISLEEVTELIRNHKENKIFSDNHHIDELQLTETQSLYNKTSICEKE